MLRLSPHRLRLGVLILVVALLGGMLPAAAQGPISDAQIVTEYLNLRAQPSGSAAVIQRLPYGTPLSLQGRTEDATWLYGTATGGATGWVMRTWVAIRTDLDVFSLPITDAGGGGAAPAGEAAPSGGEAAAVPLGDALAVATVHTRVNMRGGPGTSFQRLGTLAMGAQVGLRGRDGSGAWVYGTSNSGLTGWANTQFLTLDAAALASLPVTDGSAPTGNAAPAAEAAPAQAAVSVPAPVASSASRRGFALGGQIQGYGAEGWMRAAGMTWVKQQVVYGLGADPAGQAGLINEAHARGFQILLSVKGHANELASDPNYLQSYADFVGGLAGLGADGIEVWNEMNIDREWPAGRIDPGWYTRMLAAAYNAIKGRNPGTLVISGAPAPTGAEGAFGTDRVWNDDRYVRGLAAAGAANYMDCIGVHYNEGIVPPGQRSGDPRGEFFTRYFWGMVNTYSGAFGGSRPLCFTELGYLTPEGYGALPGGFAWAANVTVAQQAAWLADAARLASSSGRVRLMIVWNVDFTGRWGDDPMGGYAIVRPDGTCPACNALGGIW